VGKDDFTIWLMEEEVAKPAVHRALASYDFYFHSMVHLRHELGASSPKRRGEMTVPLSAYEGIVGSAGHPAVAPAGGELAGTGSST